MAQRRMFSLKVTGTDRFLDLGLTAQALYFHLGMNADDDGFIGNPKSLRRMIGASEEDFNLLVEKGYLLVFDDGVVAITDWAVSNYVKKDRYTPTIYSADRQLITVDENKRYQLASTVAKAPAQTDETALPTADQDSAQMEPQCPPFAAKSVPQVREGKVRVRKGEDSGGNKTTSSAQTISKFYQSLPDESLKSELMQFINELGTDVVAYAVKSMYESAERPTYKYLRAILNRFKHQGINTLEAAKHDNDVFNGRAAPVTGPLIPVYKLGN